VKLSNVLKAIRINQTKKEHVDFLNTNYISESNLHDSIFDAAMHLFSDNKSLFKFNAEKLSKLKNDLHVLPAKFRVPVKLKDKLLPDAVMNSLYSTSYFLKIRILKWKRELHQCYI